MHVVEWILPPTHAQARATAHTTPTPTDDRVQHSAKNAAKAKRDIEGNDGIEPMQSRSLTAKQTISETLLFYFSCFVL